MVTITNLSDLREHIIQHQIEWTRWYYRGESQQYPELIPKAGRLPYAQPDNDDKRWFRSWKRHAVAYYTKSNLADGEWLSVAQHHGLATRLLDWSFNPMIAAFFAVSFDLDKPGRIWAHYSTQDIIEIPDQDPFILDGIHRVRPSAVTPRIIRQGGIFTIHNPPTSSLAALTLPPGEVLEQIEIPSEYKISIAKELSHYGFNFMSLFPDIDGVSKHLNWVVANLPHP